jgi:hypothetical protein
MSTQEISPSPDLTRLTLFDLSTLPVVAPDIAAVVDPAIVADVRRAVAELDYPALLEEIVTDRCPNEEITLVTLIRAEYKHELAQRDTCVGRAQDALSAGMTARGREWAVLALVHAEKASAARLWLQERGADNEALLAEQTALGAAA